MGSKFFDQLVNDRRDGIAPPQLEQLAANAEPEEGPPPLEVTYEEAAPIYYEDEPGDRAERLAGSASECQLCGAVVTSQGKHTDWHRRLGA